MKNWITHQNSVIDLNSVQSFNIVEYTPSNHFAIIFHFNNHLCNHNHARLDDYKQKYWYENKPDGSLWCYPAGYTPSNNPATICHNNKVIWKFDSYEEAQKVFISLQEAIKNIK